MMFRVVAVLLAAVTLTIPLRASAQADSIRASQSDSTRRRSLTAIMVTGRADDLTGIASTASQGHVGWADLRLRPLMREGELLETVPGFVVTQHSGDGKANQYFIRGFNLDHGTDFQTRVEGMPVNMPSHAHGQGCTDLSGVARYSWDQRSSRFSARSNDIQYYYASRLPGEGRAGSTDIHFHPVEPRQLRFSLGWGL